VAESTELEKKPEPKESPKVALPRGPVRWIGVIGVAVILGGLSGSQLIAPQILGARSAAPRAGSSERERSEKGTDGPEVTGILFEIENVIVNPAGSQGSRFLMASVAIELPSAETEAFMHGHEAQVRDAVISVLENQTMQMLSKPGAREKLKEELAEALLPLSGGAKWLRVYIPQFVVQ